VKTGRPEQPWSTVSGHGRKPRAARQAARLRPAPGSARLLPSRLGALGTSERRPTVICSTECGCRRATHTMNTICIATQGRPLLHDTFSNT
jgi:hypothetical protein